MADFRIAANKPVTLEKVQLGPALKDADKSLYFDEMTGNHWKVRPDKSIQLMALSMANTNEFVTGRVMTLTFVCDERDPITFSLVKRSQTFAPPAADSALQASAYDQAVVVSR